MATHSSIVAWKIWTEEPGWLQPMESQSDTTEHACTEPLCKAGPVLLSNRNCEIINVYQSLCFF